MKAILGILPAGLIPGPLLLAAGLPRSFDSGRWVAS